MSMQSSVGLPVPATRNPFGGKGLRVSLALLLEPRAWSVSELARAAEVSQPMVSLVVKELRQRSLVVGESTRGRAAQIRPASALLWETALHWPRPQAGVQGRLPTDGPIGGGPAHGAAGLVTDAPPILYVRNRAEAAGVLGSWGGAWVSREVADYEVCVVDVHLPPGLVPDVIVALELGGTPRGREILRTHASQLVPELAA